MSTLDERANHEARRAEAERRFLLHLIPRVHPITIAMQRSDGSLSTVPRGADRRNIIGRR